MTQPVLYMIAGPNGAGKTTAALKLLPDFLSVHEFVNADEIARGLNPLNPDGQAVAAGKIMLQRVDDLIKSKKSFAFETTAASRIFVEKINQAKIIGCKTELIYLWLPNPVFAQRRVEFRVKQGGHNIPKETIERRYNRGLYNVIHLYLPCVERATIIDNTRPTTGKPEVIALKHNDNFQILRRELWDEILKFSKEPNHE